MTPEILLRRLKSAALFAAGAVLASSAFGQVTFTDNFERQEIGPSWDNLQGNWWIEADQLRSGNTSTNNFITYNEFSLADTPSFTLESNLAHNRSSGWAGLIFHAEDASNHYVMRVRPDQNRVQLIAVVDGTNNVLINSADLISPAFEVNEVYLFGVNSSSQGEFDLYIRDNTGTTVFESSVSNSLLSGGFAGFFSGSTGGADVLGMSADDFSLEVVPEPATAGLLLGALGLATAFWWRRRRS